MKRTKKNYKYTVEKKDGIFRVVEIDGRDFSYRFCSKERLRKFLVSVAAQGAEVEFADYKESQKALQKANGGIIIEIRGCECNTLIETIGPYDSIDEADDAIANYFSEPGLDDLEANVKVSGLGLLNFFTA